MFSKAPDIKKEAENSNADYQKLHQDIQGVKTSLSNLATDKDELIKLRQENGNLRRKISSMHETTIEFYSLIERTLNQPDINEEYRKATEKFLFAFDGYLSSSLGVDRIVPSPGEPFQDQFHRALGYEALSSGSSSQEFVSSCASWGYRVANWGNPTDLGVTKPAEVYVTAVLDDSTKVASDSLAETQPSFPIDSSSDPEQKHTSVSKEISDSKEILEKGSGEVDSVLLESSLSQSEQNQIKNIDEDAEGTG